MGSPQNYYGVGFFEGKSGPLTVADPVSGKPLASQGFWGAIFTPGGLRENGDRFTPARLGKGVAGHGPGEAVGPGRGGERPHITGPGPPEPPADESLSVATLNDFFEARPMTVKTPPSVTGLLHEFVAEFQDIAREWNVAAAS